MTPLRQLNTMSFNRRKHCSKAGIASTKARRAKIELLRPQIVADYKAGMLLREIGSKHDVTHQTISNWLKQWREFDADRVPAQKSKGYKWQCPQRQPDIAKAVAKSLAAEIKRVAARDNYWFKHPEARRWSTNRVAKNQFRKWKKNPLTMLVRTQRTRIWKMLLIQGQRKLRSTIQLIGCSKKHLRSWIESQFTGTMSWSNYGVLWEIDHKRPCASFDLSLPSEQEKCFHFTNLQPMVKRANRIKSSHWLGLHHKHRSRPEFQMHGDKLTFCHY